MVTALVPYREQLDQQVLQCLEHPDECTGWLEVFMVRLAGEMKLEAAIALLLDRLTDPDTWACQEAQRALQIIGTDAVVREFARRYAEGDWHMRIVAADFGKNSLGFQRANLSRIADAGRGRIRSEATCWKRSW